MSSLDSLTIRNIRSLAGDLWFARGEAYLKQDRVKDLRELQGKLSATVEGSRTYRVRLWAEEGEIGSSYSCPLGDDQQFCKHCVAVALAWLENDREHVKANRPKAQSGDHLRSFLEQQEKQKLIEIVLLEASENTRFRDRLTLEAARSNSSGVDLSVFRKSISAALRTSGIDYYSMGRYARRVHQVIESVAELLNDGHSEAVVKLTEFALGKVAKAIERVDDSDGYMSEILADLQELHHSACEGAHEDALVLATRLFEWELTSDWDIFSGAAATYAEVLGSAGLERYRSLAEAEWAEVTALGPGSSRRLASGGLLDEEAASTYHKRFRITSMMETLARQAGDNEALVAIKSRDLSLPYAFLEIAEIYRKAAQHDKALDWAEQGMRAFSPRTDSRLSSFLADEYHRRGRHAEAMELIWAEFVARPQLDTYQKLQSHALRLSDNPQIVVSPKNDSGNASDLADAPRRPTRRQTKVRRTTQDNSAWLQWREKALAYLREVIDKEKRAVTPVKSNWPRRVIDHSQLVEIFLWEKNYEDAWREATAGGCTDDLFLQLADRIAKDHPERALPIYKELIAPTLAPTNNQAYAEAIKLLRKLSKVMSALNRSGEFDDYIIALRVEYKPKRNFIKLLDDVWK